MAKEFEIDGVISVPASIEITHDQLADQFIEWIKSKGYSFGGGIGPCEEDDD